MNKADLDKAYKKLRDEFKAFKKESKDLQDELLDKILDLQKETAVLSGQEIDLEKLPHNAISVVKIEGEFKLVKLRFSLDTGEASVVELVDAGKNNKNYDIASQEAKKYLILEIMKKL